jgi:two-component system chemotaxis sensor kinase CheA
VRVDIRKLDRLMNIVGELVVSRSAVGELADRFAPQLSDPAVVIALHRELRTFERRVAELQEGILEVRMVPLGQIFDKLSRVVRKISREVDKPIDLVIRGADTELDKLIVEELSDPLMHLIRNAIDHGIESRTERVQAGKPDAGRVTVAAVQRGSHVIIEIEDDGRGIDENEVARAALRRGLVDRDHVSDLTRREILGLLFQPGFTTREGVSQLSGRGVGLDVVKTNIAHLRGMIDVQSEVGAGSKFTITLPVTLAILQALIVRAARETYAIPMNSVMESVLLAPEDVRTVERREVVRLREATLPLVRLERVFSLARSEPAGSDLHVVVVALAQHRLGIVVDDFVGRQDIVIKALGKVLSRVPGVAGAADLGNQQTVLVLDVGALIEETLAT